MDSPAKPDHSEILLALIVTLIKELQPGAQRVVTLDAQLENDLRLDSLGRVELLLRVEEAFGVSLPDQVLAQAETPRDLLRALAGASPTSTVDTSVLDQSLSGVSEFPHEVKNLVEMLEWHTERHPDRPHITFYEDEGGGELTYGALSAESKKVAAGLRALGVAHGEAVTIMLPTGKDYFSAFFGVLRAGGIPAPIYPPLRPSQIEDHLRRHTGILANALVRVIITPPEGEAVAQHLKSLTPTINHVLTVAHLCEQGESKEGKELPPITLNGGDIALLQYTSGSTGNPKGVVLTHDNLLANVRAMGIAMQVSSKDVFVSWLPLYHDMGLIGAWLGSMYHAMHLVLMSPITFMARPERWLWAAHRHKATLSGGVNFAFELCLSKIPERRLEGLNLESLRTVVNGAEPVSPETLLGFNQRFAAYGLKSGVVAPVFGLAECSVGLCFPPLNREPVIDVIQREPFYASGKALPAEENDGDPLKFVGCGMPLPGHQFRVVDETGHEVPERRMGHLEFKGPSATTGYFRNPEATKELFDGEWRRTGDMAYVVNGELFPASRAKDVIIRAGRNLYPYETEDAVGELPEIRKGNVAIFGSKDAHSGTEKLVVVVETREKDEAKRGTLREKIESIATDLMGMAPEDVVLAPPHSILKTSSGKIRRVHIRELYEKGLLGKRIKVRWWHKLARFLGTLPPALRRKGNSLGVLAYSGYLYALFLVLATIGWPLLVIMPFPRISFFILRSAVRLLVFFGRIPIRVQGLENLPKNGPYVLVANHTSFIDFVALFYAIPHHLAYAAKRELAGNFFTRWIIQRIGSRFVERFNAQQSREDATEIARLAKLGHHLAYFPEGGFTRRPGLLPFRMGAFNASVEAGIPLIPVTLRGPRIMLRDEQWLLRRALLNVQIGPPLLPAGNDFAAAVELRDTARAYILKHCGEPDLSQDA